MILSLPAARSYAAFSLVPPTFFLMAWRAERRDWGAKEKTGGGGGFGGRRVREIAGWGSVVLAR